jgi:hypothetical protein
MGQFKACQMVFIDESAFASHTQRRCMGRWFSGLRSSCVDPHKRSQRFSLLPALSFTGICCLSIFEGSVNKETFIEWLESELVSVRLCANKVVDMLY